MTVSLLGFLGTLLSILADFDSIMILIVSILHLTSSHPVSLPGPKSTDYWYHRDLHVSQFFQLSDKI